MEEVINSDKIIEDLLIDIEEEKCILLIGPDIGGSDEKSQIRIIHDELLEKEAQYISYYYTKDSLFHFRQEADKIKVIRGLKRLYRDFEEPFELYKKILELPLPLIISLNPDLILSKVATKLNLPHEFKHFRYSGEATEQVEVPSVQRPLFYNLLGCLSEEESLIMDYEDLFQLLRAVLPNGLPPKIRKKLRRAGSFLFLGFDFEKWYSQLLLQLLTYQRKGRPKFAIKGHPKDNAAKDFLIHQFQIQFLPNDEYFFDILYDTLKRKGRLRKLFLPGDSEAISIQQLKFFASENLERAMDIAEKIGLDGKKENELIVLRARLNNWKSNKQRGQFHIGESEPIFSRITNDFLDFLNDLK